MTDTQTGHINSGEEVENTLDSKNNIDNPRQELTPAATSTETPDDSVSAMQIVFRKLLARDKTLRNSEIIEAYMALPVRDKINGMDAVTFAKAFAQGTSANIMVELVKEIGRNNRAVLASETVGGSIGDNPDIGDF